MKKKSVIFSLLSILFLGSTVLTNCTNKSSTPTKKEDSMASKVERIVQKYSSPDKPGFTYMAHYDNGTSYEGAAGLASLDPARKLLVDDIFNIASVSKQFTAFAVLLLEKQGKLSVDDSLYKFMPELGDYVKPISLAHLISHSSGLANYMELAYQQGFDDQYPLSSQETLAHLSTLTQPDFSIGTQQEYSNTGYFLLAQIIERVSGMSYKNFIHQQITEPLGMTHTFVVDQYPNEETYVLSYNEVDQVDEVFWTHTGDGQVHSTVRDLMLWGENMRTGKVGGISLVQKFATPFPSTMADGTTLINYTPYAYGIGVSKIQGLDALEHAGEWMSYNCNFIRIPSKKLTLAVLSNSANIDAVMISHELTKAFLD